MKLLRQATYIPDMCQRTIKIYPNQHTISQIPFYRGFFEDKKGSGTSSQVTFFIEFFHEKFSFVMQNFITRLYLLSTLFNKMCLAFHAWAFDDVMTFEYLKS